MKGHCTSCGRDLRKGSARRAVCLGADGKIETGLVCKRCALRVIAMVVPPPVTIAPTCYSCKRELAKHCQHCVDALRQNVQELTAANVRLQQELSYRNGWAPELAVPRPPAPIKGHRAHTIIVDDPIKVDSEEPFKQS